MSSGNASAALPCRRAIEPREATVTTTALQCARVSRCSMTASYVSVGIATKRYILLVFLNGLFKNIFDFSLDNVCFRLLWLLLFKIGKCRWLSILSEYFWCMDMVSSISAIFTKRIRHSQRTSGLFFCYEFCRLFKYPLLVMLPLLPMYHCCPWMLLK